MSETMNQPDTQPGMPASQAEVESPVTKIFQRLLFNPVKVTARISSFMLVMIMLLVTTDVLGRYIFKHPIRGADELVGLMLLCAAAFAFSYTQIEHRHVRIEVLIEHLSKKGRSIFDIFDSFINFLIFSLISWQVFESARKLFFNLQGGSQSTEMLGIPWLPFMIILGLGFFIFALAVFGELVIGLVKAVRR